ncbi:hypothetical protein QTN25_000832 [Entamoeba marina]
MPRGIQNQRAGAQIGMHNPRGTNPSISQPFNSQRVAQPINPAGRGMASIRSMAMGNNPQQINAQQQFNTPNNATVGTSSLPPNPVITQNYSAGIQTNSFPTQKQVNYPQNLNYQQNFQPKTQQLKFQQPFQRTQTYQQQTQPQTQQQVYQPQTQQQAYQQPQTQQVYQQPQQTQVYQQPQQQQQMFQTQQPQQQQMFQTQQPQQPQQQQQQQMFQRQPQQQQQMFQLQPQQQQMYQQQRQQQQMYQQQQRSQPQRPQPQLQQRPPQPQPLQQRPPQPQLQQRPPQPPPQPLQQRPPPQPLQQQRPSQPQPLQQRPPQIQQRPQPQRQQQYRANLNTQNHNQMNINNRGTQPQNNVQTTSYSQSVPQQKITTTPTISNLRTTAHPINFVSNHREQQLKETTQKNITSAPAPLKTSSKPQHDTSDILSNALPPSTSPHPSEAITYQSTQKTMETIPQIPKPTAIKHETKSYSNTFTTIATPIVPTNHQRTSAPPSITPQPYPISTNPSLTPKQPPIQQSTPVASGIILKPNGFDSTFRRQLMNKEKELSPSARPTPTPSTTPHQRRDYDIKEVKKEGLKMWEESVENAISFVPEHESFNANFEKFLKHLFKYCSENPFFNCHLVKNGVNVITSMYKSEDLGDDKRLGLHFNKDESFGTQNFPMPRYINGERVDISTITNNTNNNSLDFEKFMFEYFKYSNSLLKLKLESEMLMA